MIRTILGWVAVTVFAVAVYVAAAWTYGADLPEPWSTLAVIVAVAGVVAVLGRLYWPRPAAAPLPVAVVPRAEDESSVRATRLACRLIRNRGGAVWVWADSRGITHTAFRPPPLVVEFERIELAEGLEAHFADGVAWPRRILLDYWPLPARVVANVSSDAHP